MKNQGGETKAAPRPASSSKMSSGLALEEGDSPEATAPLEGAESPGPGARRSLPAADGSADSLSSEGQETREGGFRAWRARVLLSLYEGGPLYAALFTCIRAAVISWAENSGFLLFLCVYGSEVVPSF